MGRRAKPACGVPDLRESGRSWRSAPRSTSAGGDHAIQELRDATGTKIGHVSGAWRRVAARGNVAVLQEDIRWVVTVPAIWRQEAKQFMREAAYQVIAMYTY